MTASGTTTPRPLESAALRGFKTFAAAAFGTAAVTALGLGAAHVIGHPQDAGPAAVMGFVAVIHLAHERLMGLVIGRGRLGVPDALARRIAKDAEIVARREPDGAWVVLHNGGRRVEVMDRKGFEELAGLVAKGAMVMKVLRVEDGRILVDRYQGGVLRNADEGQPSAAAVETYDRRGNLVGTRDVHAPLPKPDVIGPTMRVSEDGSLRRVPWRSGVSHSEVTGRRLPDYVKPGTQLRESLDEALARGVVHLGKGTSWLAYEAADDEPRVLNDRAYQRLRRTSRDHVEVSKTWDGVQVSRLTCGRLDSSAHGEPARLTFDADGAATGEEWYIEGRPSGKDEALEAHATYWSVPVASMG
jgi:hypothetical protein